MKCSLSISNFLEEISSLSHYVVFLYFFALIAEEGFLISSYYSLKLCIQMLISFLFSAGSRRETFHSCQSHEEGGSAYAKAGSSLGSAPGYSRASTPKNQSLPTLLLCAVTSDFTGGCPPPPSRSLCQRVNLQLQLIKFLGN